jgi:hypothetical protein
MKKFIIITLVILSVTYMILKESSESINNLSNSENNKLILICDY